MITRPTSRRAFTLIETVIVMGLGASMMVTLGLLIYNFNKMSSYEKTLSRSSDSAGALMRDIESLALPADAVLQTHTFATGTYTSSSTALVLEIPSINASGNVIANTYDYAVFYIVGTQAYRLLEVNALSSRVGGTKLLSSTLNTLTFTYNDVSYTQVHTITVDIQTRAQVKQDILSDHRREQIRLRNH